MTVEPTHVDVLVVGGGPTALLLTSLLVRSGHKILAVEQYDKLRQGLYGRACLLYAGSLEILDLIGVYERVADIGFIIKGATTYKDGAHSHTRGWSFVENALAESDTVFKHSLSLRQKHLENALREAIEEVDDTAVRSPVKLVHYRTVDSPQYPIIATIQDRGDTREVRCKYLIGADGGRSIVRKLGNFHFLGTASPHKWVRLDAIVKTNMPSSRSHNIAIESKTHGNVVWCPTDSGRTRIGFVHTHQGHKITESSIMAAAKEAVHPFTLEFVKLDWWTVYEIGQRIADTFRKGPVFLAGDAAHTHSSGAAQGMNAGIHDALNLGWKLAGVLNGLYHEEILDTFTLERLKCAERVMELDKDIASLVSGEIPEHFNAPPNADAYEYLDRLHSTNALFTTGLNISYEPNWINQPSKSLAATVEIGHRAPDGPLFRLGRTTAQQLRTLVRYTGRFWILVFSGKLEAVDGAILLNPGCAERYRTLRAEIDSPPSFFHSRPASWDFLTIISGQGVLPASETIGALPLGKALYDFSGEVFAAYGVDENMGAIVVVRPDGIVSFKTTLDGPGGEELGSYFGSLASHHASAWLAAEARKHSYEGYEFDVEGEEASGYIFKSSRDVPPSPNNDLRF
ncbi:putative 2,4-dichlorophenol 6-monooxygenase [Mycena maculata]|uniref:2,4-dichlorophenol 6-monooxygenase n=1 Tax=Mycena maculata TaxID=230809 RepID=A0AAD7P0C3_9AGAR|nr:putative 2,4-dichlorophenol 6-monooxygenase [Mycena maculata]